MQGRLMLDTMLLTGLKLFNTHMKQATQAACTSAMLEAVGLNRWNPSQ